MKESEVERVKVEVTQKYIRVLFFHGNRSSLFMTLDVNHEEGKIRKRLQ